MKPRVETIPPDFLRTVFSVDEEGNLRYVKGNRLRKPGMIAGTKRKTGYLYAAIQHPEAKAAIAAHRIVWAITYGRWPDGEIDHINRDRSDNRPENLRLATPRDNCMNRVRKLPKSGIRSVYPHNGKWEVAITFHGKRIHFGLHDDIEFAELLAQEVRRKYVPEAVA